MPDLPISNASQEQVVRLFVPRAVLPALVRRLGLAVSDGYDERGVLGSLLRQLANAATQDGSQTRIECRSCGHTWKEVPLVAVCPLCGGHYLRFEIAGGRSS